MKLRSSLSEVTKRKGDAADQAGYRPKSLPERENPHENDQLTSSRLRFKDGKYWLAGNIEIGEDSEAVDKAKKEKDLRRLLEGDWVQHYKEKDADKKRREQRDVPRSMFFQRDGFPADEGGPVRVEDRVRFTEEFCSGQVYPPYTLFNLIRQSCGSKQLKNFFCSNWKDSTGGSFNPLSDLSEEPEVQEWKTSLRANIKDIDWKERASERDLKHKGRTAVDEDLMKALRTVLFTKKDEAALGTEGPPLEAEIDFTAVAQRMIGDQLKCFEDNYLEDPAEPPFDYPQKITGRIPEHEQTSSSSPSSDSSSSSSTSLSPSRSSSSSSASNGIRGNASTSLDEVLPGTSLSKKIQDFNERFNEMESESEDEELAHFDYPEDLDNEGNAEARPQMLDEKNRMANSAEVEHADVKNTAKTQLKETTRGINEGSRVIRALDDKLNFFMKIYNSVEDNTVEDKERQELGPLLSPPRREKSEPEKDPYPAQLNVQTKSADPSPVSQPQPNDLADKNRENDSTFPEDITAPSVHLRDDSLSLESLPVDNVDNNTPILPSFAPDPNHSRNLPAVPTILEQTRSHSPLKQQQPCYFQMMPLGPQFRFSRNTRMSSWRQKHLEWVPDPPPGHRIFVRSFPQKSYRHIKGWIPVFPQERIKHGLQNIANLCTPHIFIRNFNPTRHAKIDGYPRKFKAPVPNVFVKNRH
eukprot:Gregarina_sp_Poly_1__10574@NODE_786_length_6292_cov_38_531406_g575_i0_p1_GENE_NODE_786_length_6292_cov_38_531406_g575_i0NODE_786_length_6292_cov_38_531406_g575_i0_p1_ORF_typecomplete_len695_score109_40Chorion_2/PF03964_15/0_27DUF4698/PF15769_5/1_2_NODE_786_length_6292_cov_38_531406_g575_i011813265